MVAGSFTPALLPQSPAGPRFLRGSESGYAGRMDHEQTPDQKRAAGIGAGIAIGIGVGVAMGVALDNIGLGIGIGVALGLAIGVAFGVSADAGKGD